MTDLPSLRTSLLYAIASAGLVTAGCNAEVRGGGSTAIGGSGGASSVTTTGDTMCPGDVPGSSSSTQGGACTDDLGCPVDLLCDSSTETCAVAGSTPGTQSQCPNDGAGGGGGSPPTSVPDGYECFDLRELAQRMNASTPPDACPPASALPMRMVGEGAAPFCCPTFEMFSGAPVVSECKCCYAYWTGTPPSLCGRPFVVEGEARTALVEGRTDWFRPETASADRDAAIDHETRKRLVEGWLDDARMEHASIASFARFSMQLLAVGAPPELLAESSRAALDEIAHAEACFGLASRFAGRALGPGALDMEHAWTTTTLADAVASAVVEGCIGETLAAFVASEQLRVARDPEVRHALERIVADEARHAALAYRFVAWALRQGDRDVEAAVERTFRAAIAGALVEAAPDEDQDAGALEGVALATLHAHGRLAEREVARAQREGIRELVAPCAAALLRARGLGELSLPA